MHVIAKDLVGVEASIQVFKRSGWNELDLPLEVRHARVVAKVDGRAAQHFWREAKLRRDGDFTPACLVLVELNKMLGAMHQVGFFSYYLSPGPIAAGKEPKPVSDSTYMFGLLRNGLSPG